MWAFMEEAVIRDRGCDEERNLNEIVRSYLCRRGLADTLAAFEDELEERGTPADPLSATKEGSCTEGGVSGVAARKHAQLLCLSGEFEKAAAMMPAGSPLRVKLLSLEALRQDDPLAGMAYATSKVAPLVPTCEDLQSAHAIYLQTVTSLLSGRHKEDFLTQTRDASQIANEVNEGLLKSKAPSALNVLVSWADWQEKVCFSCGSE